MKLIDKDKLSTVLGFALIILLVVVFVKLVIFDGVIGTKIYNENSIVIRYHRFINVVGVTNNSENTIYMHYQSGKCRRDANNDKRKYDIEYYKKSDDYEIKKGEKFTKFTSLFDDGYIFTVVNEKDLYDSVAYNKHKRFLRVCVANSILVRLTTQFPLT